MSEKTKEFDLIVTIVKKGFSEQIIQASIKAGASDKKITKSLSKLHDTFHKIVGLCSELEGEGHGHGEGEHNHSHGEGEHNHQH